MTCFDITHKTRITFPPIYFDFIFAPGFWDLKVTLLVTIKQTSHVDSYSRENVREIKIFTALFSTERSIPTFVLKNKSILCDSL